MQPTDTQTEAPIRVDSDGQPVMPEWSDAPPKSPKGPQHPPKKTVKRTAKKTPAKTPRKRQPKELQPDATQMDSLTEAAAWLKAHPEEAEMLRAAQARSTADILTSSGVDRRYYSSTEAAAFFDKTVQWLYWGMRHPPNGGRLFIEPQKDEDGNIALEPVDREGNVIDLREVTGPEGIAYEMRPIMVDIPVERLGDPKMGKRRFDIETIRKFAVSAYHQANIKEPKLRAVLERLIVAEGGGNWKAVPIPTRKEEDGDDWIATPTTSSTEDDEDEDERRPLKGPNALGPGDHGLH